MNQIIRGGEKGGTVPCSIEEKKKKKEGTRNVQTGRLPSITWAFTKGGIRICHADKKKNSWQRLEERGETHYSGQKGVRDSGL